MTSKFNFLDHRSGLDKIIAQVRAEHLDRSDPWIRKQAQVILAERNKRDEHGSASVFGTTKHHQQHSTH